jgi:uncharacterized protein
VLNAASMAAAVVLIGGCGSSASTTVTVHGGPAFAVQVADDQAERAQGLSGRDRLDPGTGMLFTYPQAAAHAFWMHDMRIPIDLAWIEDGVIIGTMTLRPCPTAGACEQHPSPGTVDMVLEVPAGALTGVADGSRVSVD